MSENIGNVIQIAGPAVDVQFTEAAMPPIYQALRVVSDGFTVPSPINVILEVQQHLGEGRVRCVAMEATDGMVRGMKAIDQGGPIYGFHAADHAVGRFHGDAADSAFAEVLLHFENYVDGGRDGKAVADDAEGLIDGRHGRFGELHVHGGACDLDYVSDIF